MNPVTTTTTQSSQPHPPSIQDTVPFDNYMKKLKASVEFVISSASEVMDASSSDPKAREVTINKFGMRMEAFENACDEIYTLLDVNRTLFLLKKSSKASTFEGMIHPDNWDKLEQEIEHINELHQLLTPQSFGFEDSPLEDTNLATMDTSVTNNTPSLNNNNMTPTFDYASPTNSSLPGQPMLLTDFGNFNGIYDASNGIL
mmetsp:Transcript_74/g.86  ORF Transcript_74/g.86 Transcript_74/m.86 type:complete len:201 (-) Transcript_74:11-613(-)